MIVTKSLTTERIVFLDYIRVFIIFFVIYAHAQYIPDSAQNELTPNGSFPSFRLSFHIISRQTIACSIPLFLFISGYLMAKKTTLTKSEYLNYLKKQIPKVFIPFLVWSAIYSVYNLFYEGESLLLVVKKFVYFQAAVQLYFILLIMQYYVLQPLIIKLAKNLKTLLIAFSISFLTCLFLEYLIYFRKVSIPLFIYGGNFMPMLIFPVLGAFIQIHKPVIKPKPWLLATLALLVVSFAHSFFVLIKYNQFQEAMTTTRITTVSYSAALILYLTSIKDKFAPNRLLSETAELIFGVFFIHLLYLRLLQDLIKTLFGDTLLANIPFEILLTALVFFLSVATCRLLRRFNKQFASKYLGF